MSRDGRAVTSIRPSRAGQVLRALLVGLGPVPVKFGQMLATRVDLVSAPVRAELAQLHDRVPPPRLRETQQNLRHGLGERAAGLRLEPVPVGSGSIAVVHRADVGTEPFAVKVRRSGVVGAAGRDIAVLRAGARMLSLLPAFRGLPLLPVIDQVGEGIIAQTDFTREAENLRALHEVARRWSVRIPQPVTALSSRSVLTTPFVEGLSPTGWTRASVEVRHAAVEATMNFVYDALFRHGLVHADLHPGNLYLRDGEVIVLDGGMIYRLGEFARRSFLAFFLAFATGDGPTCASIVWSSAEHRRPSDESAFRAEMIALIERHSGLTAREFSLAQFSAQLFDLQRRFSLTASPEFALPVLALLVVEGTVRRHHPSLDFQRLAVPHLLRATFELDQSEDFGDVIWRAS